MSFDSNVPSIVWDTLDHFIKEEDLDFADNYRAYRVRDELNKDDYDYAKKTGCCGSRDWKVTIPTLNEEWVIGCNYGH